MDSYSFITFYTNENIILLAHKRQNDVIFISDDTKSSLSPGCSRKKIEEKSDGDGSIQSALDAVMGKYIFICYDVLLLQLVIIDYNVIKF